MDEIVKIVASKTGLSPEIAKIAVISVISHIKSQLPKMIADQLDHYLGFSTPHDATTHPPTGTNAPNDAPAKSPDLMGSVIKGLGDILGKK